MIRPTVFLRRCAVMAAAALSACGGREAKPAGAADATPAFRVALLTPGPISDQSWNGAAYEGLTRIKDSLHADISHIQTKTPAEFEENFRQYGTQGFSVVFGHGFEFQDAAGRVAPQFPKTTFIVTSGSRTGPNIAGLRFAFEEAAYLAGMLAGAMTKSGTVGCIGGTELPPVKAAFVAFEAGAKRVRPDAKVLVSYVGNWDDVSAGKEQALAQMGRGADVIFQDADAAGLGVFQAARESGKAYVVGSNADQNGVAPEITLGSVFINVPHAMLLVAREVHDGRFTPRELRLGTKDDVIALRLNERLRPKMPAPVLAAIDSVRSAIVAGTFAVPGAPAAAAPAAAP